MEEVELEADQPAKALSYRNGKLLVAITGYVADADDDKVPWNELLDVFVDAAAWKTLENVLYELVAFGALHRIGKPPNRGRGPDTRALKLTTLGRAWLAGELVPLPTDDDLDDDDLGHDLEEIAERALAESGLELDAHTLEPGTEL